MATLNEQHALRSNAHLLARIAAALAKAAEAVRNEEQDVTGADTGDEFTATAHGYSNGDKIEFAGTGLPTGVVAATSYFVVGATTDTFQVSDTSGGTAIVLTADGFGTVAVANHPDRYVWATQTLLSNSGPDNESKRAFWLAVQNTTIQDQYKDNPTTGGTTTDGDVEFVVNGLINELANNIVA